MGFVRRGLLLAAIASCGGSPAPPPMGPMPVELALVETARVRDTGELVASLRPRRSVEVQPRVEGHVVRVFVAAGEPLTAGARILEIDPTQQRAVVRARRATDAAARASRGYWRGQYDRVQRLYRGGAATRQELDQTTSTLRSAEAQVAASTADTRAQTTELRYFEVTAPTRGTVGDIRVRVGDLVTPQTVLTTLDENDVLEAYIPVPLERAGAISVGSPIEILDASGTVAVPTRATFVSPRANSDTQTVLVKAVLENPDERLRSAQLVRARVVWSERVGPAIPVLAVQSRNGQSFVWVVRRARGDGGAEALLAEPRAVELGPIQGQRYPVTRGLRAGELIVVSGVQRLRPGAAVVPMAHAGADAGARG